MFFFFLIVSESSFWHYHYEKLQYKIIWIDHSLNKAWYLIKNFQNHSKEILNDYHERYSAKSESKLRLIIIIETMLSQWIKNKHKKTKQLIQNVFNKLKTKMNNDQKRFNKNSFAIKILARKESWINVY